MYDTPEPDIKKRKIRVYLEKWRKVEPTFVMDDLKIFAKSEREVNGLVSTVQILSNDIGNIWNNLIFGIKKCGALVMKRGKVVAYE